MSEKGMYIDHPTLGRLLMLVVMREDGMDFVFWNPNTNKYYMLRELNDTVMEN